MAAISPRSPSLPRPRGSRVTFHPAIPAPSPRKPNPARHRSRRTPPSLRRVASFRPLSSSPQTIIQNSKRGDRVAVSFAEEPSSITLLIMILDRHRASQPRAQAKRWKRPRPPTGKMDFICERHAMPRHATRDAICRTAEPTDPRTLVRGRRRGCISAALPIRPFPRLFHWDWQSQSTTPLRATALPNSLSAPAPPPISSPTASVAPSSATWPKPV